MDNPAVRIKLCGLYRERDIDYANEAKPDYIGFVFAESVRQVDAKTVEALRRKLNPGITPVGVFQNAEIAEIAALYRAGVIEIAQLHGGEPGEYIRRLREACNIPIIRAVKAADAHFPSDCDYILFDSAVPGSGQSYDYTSLPKTEKPVFLAGGVGLHNIKAALAAKPFAIDVSSGVERERGVKDRELMLALVKAVREA
ncbi:MAG: phosphoribosylanthranilate isomerase [Oscillospiraceae bacterium]|jgi:phosphoribosylanthranilate isomerase|nr:phosphoribosylanthranilate isomerase [Oscillospiraceae bacterium]